MRVRKIFKKKRSRDAKSPEYIFFRADMVKSRVPLTVNSVSRLVSYWKVDIAF